MEIPTTPFPRTQPRGASQTRRMHLQERFREHGDVLLVRAQWWQFDGHDAQPVEQVFAKPSRAN